MSRCLVTGGAGFIGSHLVDLLLEQGHTVTVLDNLSTGKPENLNQKSNFLCGDIREQSVWDHLGDFDFVYHLAALARIQPSIQDPVGSNDVNLVGTLRALEYCRRVKAKIIFSGSSSVYRGELLPTIETDDKDPQSPYAMQKLMSEQYIRLYQRMFQVPYVVLRYFNVYGERQIIEGAYAAVVGIFLNQKANGQKMTVTGDGEQRRDFTYVKDVAQANLMAMKWQGTFNIGTGINYSMNELADMVGGEIEYIAERLGEARETLADNQKALAKGWKPTKNIGDWVNENIH